MGRARAIDLGTISFAKAGDAVGFFSAMLARYADGQKIDQSDAVHLAALLKRHDEYEEKVGVGVAFFIADRAPPPYENQRCFWIVRHDLSRIDFSYQHCLEKKPYD